MDSIEVVKIVGAILAVALVVLLARFITEQVYPEPEVAAWPNSCPADTSAASLR